MRPRIKNLLLMSALISCLGMILGRVAMAQTFTTLYTFTGKSDGASPHGALHSEGRLYGTTPGGGPLPNPAYGTVFALNTDGTGFATLHSFAALQWDGSCCYTNGEGVNPNAGLILSSNRLYGTANSGGSGKTGTLFAVNTNGAGFAVLHSFTEADPPSFTNSDGVGPWGALILSGSTLYGTAGIGGSSVKGTVFKVSTDGTGFRVLHDFANGSGAVPEAALILSGDILYGTTACTYGPYTGSGTVFALRTDGTGFTTLYSFSPTNADISTGFYTNRDGANPVAGLVLFSNMLYGTTISGGRSGNGTVFKLNTNGTSFTTLHSFSALSGTFPGSNSDGACPSGGVVLSGKTLYGTAYYGGSSGLGTVFKVNTDGTGFRVLYNFSPSAYYDGFVTNNDGGFPYGGLTLSGNTLYGTARGGGRWGCGTVFGLSYYLSITKQPLTQTVEAGSAVEFRVGAESLAPVLAYQWFFGGTNAILGATNALLALTNVQPVQAGAYAVVVTDQGSSVTSAPAMLGVISPIVRTVVPAVSLTGGTGNFLHLEYSDRLAAAPLWLPLSNVTLSGGPQFLFDLSQPLPAQRFYRAWQTNGPQPALDATMATEIPMTGTIGSSVRVDYINVIGPTNAWVTLDTVLLTNTTQYYFDVTAFRQPARLYRLVPVP